MWRPTPAGQNGEVFGVFAQQTIVGALFFDNTGDEFLKKVRIHN
jgi:hypothetical protein